MELSQKVCQNQRTINQFLLESLCQVFFQKRHTIFGHQNCRQTHLRKLQTLPSWFSNCISLYCDIDYKIQWSVSSYYWSNQYDHLKILPKRKILLNWRVNFGMLKLWDSLNNSLLRTLQWSKEKYGKESFRLWLRQIKWLKLFKLYKN